MLLATKFYIRTMNHNIQDIIALLEEHKDKEKAVQMAAYMRNKFPFLGIQAPERQKLLADYIRNTGKISISEVEMIVSELWQLKEREYHYLAMDMLNKLKNQLMPSHIEFLENLLLTHSWWDTVDVIAPRHIGTLFLNYPELKKEYLYKWNESTNIWLNRTSIIFQLRYKEQTSFELLKEMIEPLKDSTEFFIKKAIGWALREYSKTNQKEVEDYISKANLSPLSEREALKYIRSFKSK